MTTKQLADDPSAQSGPRRASETDAQEILRRLETVVADRARRALIPAERSLDIDKLQTVVAPPRHSGRLLGSLLVTRGYLIGDELSHALKMQAETGEKLGEVLVRLGLLTDDDLVELLAEQHKMETVQLDELTIDPKTAGLVSTDEASLRQALPFRTRRGRVDIAIADPRDVDTIEFLVARCGRPIRLYLTTTAAIETALKHLTEQTGD